MWNQTSNFFMSFFEFILLSSVLSLQLNHQIVSPFLCFDSFLTSLCISFHILSHIFPSSCPLSHKSPSVLTFVPSAFPAQAAGEREAEWVGSVQWEEQGAVWVAHTDGEQGLAEWRHQHWGDDRKAAQGDFSALSLQESYVKYTDIEINEHNTSVYAEVHSSVWHFHTLVT